MKLCLSLPTQPRAMTDFSWAGDCCRGGERILQEVGSSGEVVEGKGVCLPVSLPFPFPAGVAVPATGMFEDLQQHSNALAMAKSTTPL